jgi:hypothetical protein
VNKSAPFLAVLAAAILFSCGAPKPTTPALTPQTAAELLQYNNKAKDWLIYVKKQNPACEYKLDLPDQISQPTSIDLDHIVSCAGRPSPKEFDASVSFAYDKAAGHWVITRFAS